MFAHVHKCTCSFVALAQYFSDTESKGDDDGLCAIKPGLQLRKTVSSSIQTQTTGLVPYFSGYKTEVFFLPKQSQKFRSVSRSLGLFRKAKNRIISKLQRSDIVICSYSRKEKAPSYSRLNMVQQF